MKLRQHLLVCFILLHVAVDAQIKIGNNSTSINSASLLELETTNKGLVFPRISLSDVSLSSPLPSGLLTGTVVFNTNASVTNGNGIGIYVWNGSIWIPVSPNISSAAWGLTGNTGTSAATNFLGTLDNISLRLRTNNVERLLIDSLGDIGIGSSAFSTTNREKLLLDYGVTASNTLATLRGSINNYFQVNLQNLSSGANASSDYIATSNDGTDSTYYIDMGINSSTYARSNHNWGGAHDSYLYSNSRNLLIGTATSSDVIFMTGGGAINSNGVMRLKYASGNIVIGKGENTANPSGNMIRGPNGNGISIPGGSLMLSGGAATDNAAGGDVSIYGGTSVSGVAGSVNINTDINSNTYLNTGTSTGNITLGNLSNNVNIPKLPASSIVTTDVGKNLSFTTPSSNTYLFYNGSSFTWQNTSTTDWNLTGNAGTSGSANFIGTTDAIDFVAKTNNIERMRVTSSGSVGIGVTNPQQSLSVSNGLNIDQSNGNTGSTTNALTFGNGSGEGIGSKRNAGGNQYGLDFYTSFNNRMTITNGGLVGIGITSPGYKLSVLSSSNPLYLSGVQATAAFTTDSLLTIYNGVVKAAPFSSLTNNFWSLTGNGSTNASSNFIGTTDAVDFVAKTNNSERFRITSAGNVGINTSSPGSTLDVKGTLRLSGSSSGYVALAPAAAAGATTYTLPSADGTAGQALITNGSGTLSWAIAAATIGTIGGTGATIQGTATGKYYCTGSYITLPPGKFIVNVYMMLSSTTNPMTQTTPNQPGSFFIKSFFADASLGTVAGATVSPPLPQSYVSPDVVGNGKLISGSLSVGQTYNPITGFVVINNTSGANKSYYYWAGWVSLTNVSSTNSLPLIGGTNYGEDNIVAYPAN